MVIYQITFQSTGILGYSLISSIHWFLNYVSWLVSNKKNLLHYIQWISIDSVFFWKNALTMIATTSKGP